MDLLICSGTMEGGQVKTGQPQWIQTAFVLQELLQAHVRMSHSRHNMLYGIKSRHIQPWPPSLLLSCSR